MLEIKTFEVGSFGTNMYLVSDDAGNILLIDPACSSLYEQQMLYRSVNEVVYVLEFISDIFEDRDVHDRWRLRDVGFDPA